MWGKVSRLRKRRDSRDWASNHRQSDLKSNALSTTPPRPLKVQRENVPNVGGVVNQVSYRMGFNFMPSVCRSFQDLLVVQISHKLTKY